MARLHLDTQAPAVRGQRLAVAAVRRGDLRVEFAHGFFQLPAPEARAEVDRVAVPLQRGGAHGFLRAVADPRLGQVHALVRSAERRGGKGGDRTWRYRW